MRRSVARIALLAVLLAAGTAAAKPPFKSPFRRGLSPLDGQPLLSIGNDRFVGGREYRDLSLATRELLRRYPADQHYFIGLGRDPAPIIAFLQNLGGRRLAVNFPASSNSKDEAEDTALHAYVDRLVPPEVFESGRAIVFVDVTHTARGLTFYVPRLTPYLHDAKVRSAAFWSTAYPSKREGIDVIDTSGFPGVRDYPAEPYEGTISEYPRHVPGHDSAAVLDKPRPRYQQYRDALQRRMERDAELDTFLKSQGWEPRDE